jgi:hypothetical protein
MDKHLAKMVQDFNRHTGLRHLGMARRRYENNIRTDLKEMGVSVRK